MQIQSVENPELKGLPFKASGVGQFKAVHATPTDRNFVLGKHQPKGYRIFLSFTKEYMQHSANKSRRTIKLAFKRGRKVGVGREAKDDEGCGMGGVVGRRRHNRDDRGAGEGATNRHPSVPFSTICHSEAKSCRSDKSCRQKIGFDNDLSLE